MSINAALKTAIGKAASKYRAKHPKHSKRGAASRGEDAEYEQSSEASHAESGVVVGHPKTGKNSKKGMDDDYKESTKGNSAKVLGKGEKRGKAPTRGEDEEYEAGYNKNKSGKKGKF